MWVYQASDPLALPSGKSVQPEDRETSPVETSRTDSLEPVMGSSPAEPVPADAEASRVIDTVPKPHRRFTSQGCILLLLAYLFGTFLAGILSAVCNAGEAETLGYYLNCWRESFSAANTADVVRLFWTELLTVSGALTVLLLFGLSAVGTIPIFCFMILYGTGTGVLSLQLLSQVKWQTLLVYGLASGIPSALAAGTLCLFGTSALQVSGKIQRGSFGKMLHSTGAWSLVGQFARTLFLFLPICGAATGLLYFCGQWKLL